MTPAMTAEPGTPTHRPPEARIAVGPWLATGGALLALAVAWIWPLRDMASDLFAAHMFQHLLVMNGAALLIALALPAQRHSTGLARVSMSLPIVTGVQLALLYLWHLPALFAMAHHSIALQIPMQLSLFAAGLLFWRAIVACRGDKVWAPIFALLMTAKIFCLLGAAFVFSRRALYPAMGDPDAWGFTAIEDQQLAGLLMVSSCALVYVAAAIWLFARWMFATPQHRRRSERNDAAPIAS
ncbi:MAG: cytochrome c oxidase assembly protein [Dongiaceae bacterium]